MLCSEKDWLLLSRYLAGALSSHQVEVLESRLSSESNLSIALIELKRTRSLLAHLPEKKVPHNFTIKPGTLPYKLPARLFPVFRLATAVCSILFVIAIAYKTITFPMQSNQAVKLVAHEVSEQAEPKVEIPSADTLSSTIEPLLGIAPAPAGAGAPAEAPAVSPPSEETTRAKEYIEEQYIPNRSATPWVQIVWVLGGLGLVLVGVAILFYYRERV